MKMNKKKYNTTDINHERDMNNNIFHRNIFAHYLRCSHILKESRIGETICDFGCGSGALAEVLYRNRFKQKSYVGIDIRDKFDQKLLEKDWIHFYQDDLIKPTGVIDYN